ncbi:MAG TPA: orotate phosphoribosyltransferase [Bacillota bacterium]
MTEQELRDLLERTGAWLRGHFRLTTGLHSPEFFLLARLFQYPELAERCGRALADRLGDLQVTAVVGPAMGGVLLAHEVARALGVRALFAEREADGSMRLRRGFELSAGEPVLVVEDAVTTGGSAQSAAAAARAAGGEPVAVAAVIDRSGGRADFGVPFYALLRVEVPVYRPEACPLCHQGIPLSEPKR